jgi:transposase
MERFPGFAKLPIETRYELINAAERNYPGRNAELAAYFGVTCRTIINALSWGAHPYPIGTAGRNKKLNRDHEEFILIRTEADKKLTNLQLAHELMTAFPGLQVSETVVGNCRKELGFRYLPMRAECRMTDQARNRRVQWCLLQQERNTNWENVVFSDESWFELGPRKQYVWRRSDDYGPDVCYSRQAHPKKVMVWGAVGYNYKSPLHFVTHATVDGDYYLDEITLGRFLDEADRAFGHTNWLFQQDNARPHIRRDIRYAMETLDIKLLEDWPPYSPDLNIIERVWAIMKRRLDDTHPENVEDLKNCIQVVWDNLSPALINSLVAEMPRRLIEVIQNKGRTIHHI